MFTDERIGNFLITRRIDRPNHKTATWLVHANEGIELGIIEWGPWRQYNFIPSANTTFSAGCLDDIAAFLKRVRNVRQEVVPQ